MKTKAIASQYGIDQTSFEVFLTRDGSGMEYSLGLASISVDDNKVQEYVEAYQEACAKAKAELADRPARMKAEVEERAAREKAESEEMAAKAKIKARAEAEENMRKKRCMAEMLISSGCSFEGYRIVRYSDYVSGDAVTQIPRSGVFSGNNNGANLTKALAKIRRKALIELKEAAYHHGCNAVVGVDFDYITLAPETASATGGTLYEAYVICVTANGNAVVIEHD